MALSGVCHLPWQLYLLRSRAVVKSLQGRPLLSCKVWCLCKLCCSHGTEGLGLANTRFKLSFIPYEPFHPQLLPRARAFCRGVPWLGLGSCAEPGQDRTATASVSWSHLPWAVPSWGLTGGTPAGAPGVNCVTSACQGHSCAQRSVAREALPGLPALRAQEPKCQREE